MANSSLPIAVQLYTLRNLTLPFPELLAQVAAIGYTGVETTSNHGCTIDEMRALLDKNQLKVVSAHVGLPLLESDLDGVVAFNIGGMISMTQMSDLASTPLYLAVSLFLAFTAVFFAAATEAQPQVFRLIFNAYLAAAVIVGLTGVSLSEATRYSRIAWLAWSKV